MKIRTFWANHFPVMILLLLLTVVLSLVQDGAIRTASEYAELNCRHKIIIDAGHGGEDGGATSCTGILESKFNLEISLRLEQILSLLGYETIMVRTEDRAVHTQGETIAARKASDLKARVQLVNNTERGVLISIHQNYFPESQYWGAQVFYAKTDKSKELAQTLQSALVSNANPGSKRKAKPSEGIYLMEQVICPAVLIECGFLSNPNEEARLRNEEYQKRLSCIIAATVAGYFSS